MAIGRLLVGKGGSMRTPVIQIKGDGNTHVIELIVQRYYGGIDLAPLTWSVTAENANGATDEYDVSNVQIKDDVITMLWTLYGTVTAAAGIARFKLTGYSNADNKVLVWQSGTYCIGVSDTIEYEPGSEVGQELSNVHKLIAYVDQELPSVLAARENANSAAERANEAAEHVSDGATFTPSVSSDGVLSWTNDKGLTNPDPVNIKGDTGADGEDGFSPTITVEEITGGHRVTITDASGTKSFDVMDGVGGSGGSGLGDMLKSTYDTDGSGVVDDAEKLGGQPPSYYEVPKYLTEEGESYSVTGDVVTVENYGGMPMNVVTTIEPVQEGSGDPSPDNIRPITGHTGDVLTRCGKNFVKLTFNASLTVTENADGTVTATNIVSGPASGPYCLLTGILPAGTYTIKRYDTPSEMYVQTNGNTDYSNLIEPYVPYTFEYDGESYLRIKYGNVPMNTSETYKVQLELGSAATEYEPYNAETFTVDFGETVYGGTHNWNTGVLMVEWGLISSYAGETLPGEWISDRDVYAEGMTPTTGAQVCYKFAIPTTIQLTPQYIYALGGTNIIYCDAGTTTVSFSKSIFGLIDSLIKRIAALESAAVNNV